MSFHLTHISALLTGLPRVSVRLLLLCWTLLSLPGVSQADSGGHQEYQVKAAFLYNFARFTTWPDTGSGTFNLCILGNNPFEGAVESLRNKPVHEKPLAVIHIDSARQAANCQLLYIDKSLSGQLAGIIAELGRYPVLTVSDIDGFINHGGTIGFLVIDNRIRFEINIPAASNAGLSISSKLLTLATTVRTGR
jgi:YfiR/HmsC-like